MPPVVRANSRSRRSGMTRRLVCVCLAVSASLMLGAADAPKPQDGASVPSPAAGDTAAAKPAEKDVLDLNLEELGKVDVRAPSAGSRPQASPTATGSVLNTADSELSAPGSLGELLNQAPSVS